MYRDNKMDSIQIEYTYEEALIKIPRFGYNGGNYIAVYREKEYCCHINENGTVIIFFDKKAT